MGLIEGILCEVNHCIIDVIGLILRDPVPDAARNVFPVIAVDEVLTLLLHHLGFLLAHGAADEVGAAERIAAEVTHDAHDLLLVDDAAVGRFENRAELLCLIRHGIRIFLAGDVFRDKFHRARTVEGDAGDDVLKALGL